MRRASAHESSACAERSAVDFPSIGFDHRLAGETALQVIADRIGEHAAVRADRQVGQHDGGIAMSGIEGRSSKRQPRHHGTVERSLLRHELSNIPAAT